MHCFSPLSKHFVQFSVAITRVFQKELGICGITTSVRSQLSVGEVMLLRVSFMRIFHIKMIYNQLCFNLISLQLNFVLDMYSRRVLLGPSLGPNGTRRL